MHEIIMRMRSGREYRFTCKEYKISKFEETGKLIGFSAKEVIGECPIFFEIPDVESIVEITKEEGE